MTIARADWQQTEEWTLSVHTDHFHVHKWTMCAQIDYFHVNGRCACAVSTLGGRRMDAVRANRSLLWEWTLCVHGVHFRVDGDGRCVCESVTFVK